MERLRLLVIFAVIVILTACNLPQPGMVLPTAEPLEQPSDSLDSDDPLGDLIERPDGDTPIPEAIAEGEETNTYQEEPAEPEIIRHKMVLISGAADTAAGRILKEALPAYCEEHHCDYEEVSSMPDDADFAFFAEAPADVTNIAADRPDTRVIIFGGKNGAFNNVWTIQYDPNVLPFLAGLAVASNAYDWRGLGLLPSDSPLYGMHTEEAFTNGTQYFCGDCRALMPPYNNYPLTVTLPESSDANAWINAINEAETQTFHGIFLSEASAKEEVFQKLLTMNVKLIGSFPPPAGLENNWLATINYDWNETFTQIVHRSDAGEAGGLIPAQLLIQPGQLTEEFSRGRAQLLQESYDMILSGLLSPLSATEEYQSGQ